MERIRQKLKGELNWKERILLKLFGKTFNKIFNIIRIEIVNNVLKN